MVGSETLRLTVMYRPPPSKANGHKAVTFIEEWSAYMERFTTVLLQTYVLGDLNIHFDKCTDSLVTKFLAILDSCGFQQLVKGPTHVKGHTLDVNITQNYNTNVHNINVSDPALCDRNGQFTCDHYVVSFTICLPRPMPVRQTVSYRKLRSIDIQSFKEDLSELISGHSSETDPLETYNTKLRELIDKHAPECERTIVLRPHAPWYTEELRDAKRHKRRLEKQWRESRLIIHHQLYREACAEMNKLLHQAKSDYYSCKISECERDQKKIHKISKHLLGEEETSALPEHSSPLDMANRFSDYFRDKIATIRQGLDSADVPPEVTILYQPMQTTLK